VAISRDGCAGKKQRVAQIFPIVDSSEVFFAGRLISQQMALTTSGHLRWQMTHPAMITYI
jgi:hypothetical protein